MPQGASALWKAVSKTLRPDISNTFEIKLRKGYRQNMALAERRRHRNVPETERRTTGEKCPARAHRYLPRFEGFRDRVQRDRASRCHDHPRS